MPEQFFPDGFQARDPSGIWGFDPILVMVLSFTVVPIALAVLVLTLGALGRLLGGFGSEQSVTRLADNRFKELLQPQTTARLEARRWTAHRREVNTASGFRRRDRLGARRLRERRLRRRERPRSTRSSADPG